MAQEKIEQLKKELKEGSQNPIIFSNSDTQIHADGGLKDCDDS